MLPIVALTARRLQDSFNHITLQHSQALQREHLARPAQGTRAALGTELDRKSKRQNTHAQGEGGADGARNERAHAAARPYKRERAPAWTPEIPQAGTGRGRALGARASAMAHRPKRTFRQRRAHSSDSDDAEERSAEPEAPGQQAAPGPPEEGPPSGGGRAEVTDWRARARGPRGRGRVWASSRRAAGAAPRAEGSAVPGEAGLLGSRRDAGRGAGLREEALGLLRWFPWPL